MIEKNLLDEFERYGIDKKAIDLPIIHKLLTKYHAYHWSVKVGSLLTRAVNNSFTIGDTMVKIMEDGTLRIQEKHSKEYSLTDKTGLEVEKVLEVTEDGERKLVRHNGVIREVLVTDQGTKYTSKEMFLDNGDPEIQAAIGAKIRDKEGNPIFFNHKDALQIFDENMLPLRNGTTKEKRYYREARIKLEEAIQDEKISRLPLEERLKALKEIEEDLSVEYRGLCDFIGLNLEDHKNKLSLIEKITTSPTVSYIFGKNLDEYKRRLEKLKLPSENNSKSQNHSQNTNNNDSKQDKTVTDEEALIESIYYHRIRNAELRGKLDRTTDILNSFDCIQEVIDAASEKFGILFKASLIRYNNKHKNISLRKAQKVKEIEDSKATIKHQREDSKKGKKLEGNINPNITQPVNNTMPKKSENDNRDSQEL